MCHTVPLRPLRTCPLSQSVTNLIPTKRHIFGPTRCLRPGHRVPPPRLLTGSRLGRRKSWKGLINLSLGVFGVEAAEGCCLQGQSSPHDGGDWRQLRDGCWVLLLSSVGLPSPVQAPQPRSRSPSLQTLRGRAAPFPPVVLKPQNSQKSPCDGGMQSELLSLLFECPYIY